MNRYEISPRLWAVLEGAAEGSVYRDTHNISMGWVSVHPQALDLIDLGLLDRADHGKYRPTLAGEKALEMREAGQPVVMEFAAGEWRLIEGNAA